MRTWSSPNELPPGRRTSLLWRLLHKARSPSARADSVLRWLHRLEKAETDHARAVVQGKIHELVYQGLPMPSTGEGHHHQIRLDLALRQWVQQGARVGTVHSALALGANPRAFHGQDNGESVLILAAQHQHPHLIPVLLQAGANPHLGDVLGQSGWEWLEGQSHHATPANQAAWDQAMKALWALPGPPQSLRPDWWADTPGRPVWWSAAERADLRALQRFQAAGSTFEEQDSVGRGFWEALCGEESSPALASGVLECAQWRQSVSGKIPELIKPGEHLLARAVRYNQQPLAAWLLSQGHSLRSVFTEVNEVRQGLPHLLTSHYEPEDDMSQWLVPLLPVEAWSWLNNFAETALHNPEGRHIKHQRWAVHVEACLLRDAIPAPTATTRPRQRL